LIPRLGSRDSDHVFLTIPDVKVEVGEELILGQRISRIDAQIGESPWWLNIVWTADFYPVSHAKAVGDTRKEARRHIQIPL
jgi:hypothetical protein